MFNKQIIKLNKWLAKENIIENKYNKYLELSNNTNYYYYYYKTTKQINSYYNLSI